MATARRPLWQRMPWFDRAGRFSILKTATLVGVAAPALWLAYEAATVGLGPRPFTEAIHRLGDWTIYLLLITLTVTPARRLLNWGQLIQIRRILGVSALAYILGHFLFYIVDSKWNLLFVGQEIVLRFYLAIGFVAIVMLSILGATSTDAMIKRIGGQHWRRLHQLVYPATALGILHYYLQSKLDVSQPVIMSGFFFWLMGYRIMAHYGPKEGFLPLTGLAVASALMTAAVEALWYQLMTGVGGGPFLAANLDFAYRIAPMWWVLAAGLAVVVVAEVRRRLGGVTAGRRAKPA